MTNLAELSSGKKLPDDINVFIEIPAFGPPIKYELDKDSGVLMVDRFLATCMQYPCNYGFIPNTLAEDEDPMDVLVITPFSLQAGVLIRCRPVGMLQMTDEKGKDTKIIAVPHDKITTIYQDIQDIDDVPELLKQQIKHFFEHYKDLEVGKWVKVDSFENAAAAKAEIIKSAQRATP
jgi:inorganic pyrophosphatase